MTEMRYLFLFEPLDSFSFSGETSARTAGLKSDPFLKHSLNASRRQSFLVETDCIPPQTSVMGAVRRMLYGKADIGDKSFSISDTCEQKMGVIKGISPVFLQKNNDTYLLPAPKLIKLNNTWQPVMAESYKPKDGTTEAFFEVDCKGNFREFVPADEVFLVYKQPVFHVPRIASDTGDYHVREKCMLNKCRGFCTIVTADKTLSDIKSMLLPLGSKDGQFRVSIRELSEDDISFGNLSLPPFMNSAEKCYCLSLLSPAFLQKDWRQAEGLQMAFCDTKPIRCATTTDTKNFQLQLISEKLVAASRGSVFIFKTQNDRDRFAGALQSDNRSVCGFNQPLCYTM